jgi:hypothetical protein
MNISNNLRERVSWAIEFAWQITLRKISDGEIKVFKEASLQLHFSAILKEILNLIKFAPQERFDLELESTVQVNNKPSIIDVLVSYKSSDIFERHAIELKCYRTLSASGKNRGANDIFMHAVYEDLYITEQYLKFKVADITTCLILTDYENFINPKRKTSKNWMYDISHDYKLNPNRFTTPIGGRNVDFSLESAYHFYWSKFGKFWGTLIRPL